jgi:hypothetical protein
MVTIKDGRGARQVTAEEAFFLYLRKKAVDGDEAAQERLEEIQAFRREHDPDLGSEGITTIVRVIVSPDNPNYALRLLKMAVKLYPFQLTPKSGSSHGLSSARSIGLATGA